MLKRTKNEQIYKLHDDRMDFGTGELLSPTATQNYTVVQVADTYSVLRSAVASHIQRCDVELTIVGYGSVSVCAGAEECRLRKGDCFLSLSGDEHSLAAAGGSRYQTVAFNVNAGSPSCELLTELIERFGSPKSRLFPSFDAGREPAEIIGAAERGDRHSAAVLDACITRLLVRLLDGETTEPEIDRRAPLPEITTYIDENFLTIGRLSSLSEVFGYSYGHLRRLFRTRYGFSMGEYYMHKRMEHARHRLAGGASAAEVSDELGYSSCSDFSHAFRNYYGVTPGGVRKGEAHGGRGGKNENNLQR